MKLNNILPFIPTIKMSNSLKILQEEFAKSARLLVIMAVFQILKHLQWFWYQRQWLSGVMVKHGLVGQSCHQPMCKQNKTNKLQHLQLNSTLVFCCPLKQFGEYSLAWGWDFYSTKSQSMFFDSGCTLILGALRTSRELREICGEWLGISPLLLIGLRKWWIVTGDFDIS